ncbi:MAG: SH3 domain-containing protein [Rhizobiaceae bacterium]
MRLIITIVIIAIHMAASAAIEARATSGPGCLYVVNVANWDRLNMRARPSARSPVVDRLKQGAHGILHLERTCGPKSRPWGQRWCRIKHYNGDRVTTGYVKARYVRDSDCP